ncbi:MAG TPA: hypothetical protein VGQ69_00045 [Gemmatimonadales bacterium]|jgi:hypothetical protein|nr:hypothetical protein [Gemmatimonadales bacterium]
MPRRIIEVNGQRWAVAPAGRITQYDKDEFALRFTRFPAGSGPERIVRYSPLLAKSREASLAQLSDQELVALFQVSQPSWTSAELGYHR